MTTLINNCWECNNEIKFAMDASHLVNLPHPNKLTDLISSKLMQFKHADVPNLAKLITSYLDPNECIIKYHSDIPSIKNILHDCESYTSGRFENHSGILLVNLEYKCNCFTSSRVRNLNTLPRGIYIPRMYFDMNGDLMIDTFKQIKLPKSRVAVMATATGGIGARAIVKSSDPWYRR